MLSALVLFAVVAITEAGNTHQPKLGLHHQHPSNYRVRPIDTMISDITNPLRLSPILKNLGSGFTAQIGNAVETFKRHPAPINKVAIRPASTITHIPSPVLGSPVPVLPLKVLNSVPIRHAVKVHDPIIKHIPPSSSTVFSPLSFSQTVKGSSLTNSHKGLNPAINNYKVVHKVQKIKQIVTYALSEKDYQYLKQHKTEGGSPFTPVLGEDTASPNVKHQNIHSNHDENKDVTLQKSSEVSNADNVLKINAVSNVAHQGYAPPNFINIPEPVAANVAQQGYDPPNIINIPEPVAANVAQQGYDPPNIINIPEPVAANVAQQGYDPPNFINIPEPVAANVAHQGYFQPSFINAPESVVTKHIYFYVPQPEFEEPIPPPVNIPPPKKSYSILFIKVQSQEEQNQAFIRQVLQSRQPQIEDKTLIYVLSKKQEPEQAVVLPSPKIFRPEVFFVNYQTKLGDVTDIRESLVGDSYSELERKRRLEHSQPESDSTPKN